MAINKKLIHFKNKENFDSEVANGNILDNSIVFIQDSKEISTHDTVYKTVNWSVFDYYYYSTIETALSDINNNTVNKNANSNKENAQVGLCITKAGPVMAILKDINITNTLNCTKSFELDLNGNEISSTNCTIFNIQNGVLTINTSKPEGKITTEFSQLLPMINISGGDCIINGGAYHQLTHGVGLKDSPHSIIIVQSGRTLNICNSSFLIEDDNGGAVSTILVKENGTLIGNNCNMIADSITGLSPNAVYSDGVLNLTKCKLIGKSNHTANAAGTDYATTSRGILANSGSVNLKDCYAYGTHSGATIKCELYVDGGTYIGYSHGGFYLNMESLTARLYNASIKEGDMLDGYISDAVAGTNNAGMYIGGASNMNIYVDNCRFYGTKQPIVLKFSSTASNNNTLYISNSSINLDYINYGIRNDGSNKVKLGVGNNFNETDLRYNQNYEITEDNYREI